MLKYLCLFLDFGGLLHVLFGLFLFVRRYQLFGLVFEQFDFVLEFFLLLFKDLNFGFQVVLRGLDFEFLFCDFVGLGLDGWGGRGFFLLIASSKEFIEKRHKIY